MNKVKVELRTDKTWTANIRNKSLILVTKTELNKRLNLGYINLEMRYAMPKIRTSFCYINLETFNNGLHGNFISGAVTPFTFTFINCSGETKLGSKNHIYSFTPGPIERDSFQKVSFLWHIFENRRMIIEKEMTMIGTFMSSLCTSATKVWLGEGGKIKHQSRWKRFLKTRVDSEQIYPSTWLR